MTGADADAPPADASPTDTPPAGRADPGADGALEAIWPQSLLRHELVELDDGRSLGFGEWGADDGDPLLWFHGTPGAGLQVPPNAPREAAARGYRLIVVERPGTGWSTPHRYGRVRDFADDVGQLADLLELDRFAVAGLSGGGPFVLAVAHEMPDRVVTGAVLGGIGPTTGPEQAPGYTRILPLWEPLLRRIRDPFGGVVTSMVQRASPWAVPGFGIYKRVAPQSDRAVFDDPEMEAMFIHDVVTAAARGFGAPLHDLALFAKPWGFSLRDVSVPITFWHGDADSIVPLSHSEHQAALVQDGTVVVKPGAGHFAGFTVIEEVLDTVDLRWHDRGSRP